MLSSQGAELQGKYRAGRQQVPSLLALNPRFIERGVFDALAEVGVGHVNEPVASLNDGGVGEFAIRALEVPPAIPRPALVS